MNMQHDSLSFIVQFMAANSAMQGAYIPQYAHMQASNVPLEVRATTSLQPDECRSLLMKAKYHVMQCKEWSLFKTEVHFYFTLCSRKMAHSHKWTLPAIIPHIPTNKPSSSEVTFGTTAETIMSTDAEDLFTVLHRFCKCLSETIFGIMFRENIWLHQYI